MMTGRGGRMAAASSAIVSHGTIVVQVAGLLVEAAGPCGGAVEHRDPVAFFSDVERQIGPHHAEAYQPDVGVCHRSSPLYGSGSLTASLGPEVSHGDDCRAPALRQLAHGGPNRLTFAALAAVELEPMMHDIVTQRAGDLVLQMLDPVGFEFDDVTRLDIDQMIVMSPVACSKRDGPPSKAWRWMAPMSPSSFIVR